MNLEQFKQTVVPTLTTPYRITEKGFYRRFKLQSIYKTEFPFNKEYERFFLIEDNIYKLSDSTWNDVNQAFKEEQDVNEVLFQHKDKILVNVPLPKFILVNEAETENLIVVPKDRSSETIVKEYQEKYNVESDRTIEQYEQKQMNKWTKIDAKVEQALQNIDDKLENERIMREAKNMVDNSLETTKDFQDFIQHRLAYIDKTLVHKGREYTETNWLDNFEDACKFKGLEINCENLLKVLDGYRLKHQVSIMKLQKDIANGKSVSVDLINEKYGDLMNYNLLEQAIITKYNYINKVSF